MPEGFASTELAFTASQDVQPPDFVSLGRFLASPYRASAKCGLVWLVMVG
jgi:hypothetical protein